jgi:hypothetical protein
MAGRTIVAALVLTASADLGAQTLDDILAKNLTARGGLDRLRAVQTARLTGRITFGPGMEAPFTLERKRPRSMRSEFKLDEQTGVQAFDGQNAWTLMPFAGQREPERLLAEERLQVEEQADFDGPLVDWKAKGHALELLGRDSVDGVPCWKLRLTTKAGAVRTIFLDAATFLESKSVGRRVFGGNEIEFESTLADYRDVDGLKLPFTIAAGPLNAPERQRIRFERIELGVPIDDARFAMPAARR